MRVLVLGKGSGGREHALAWRLSQDNSVDKVYAAPGNPGMAKDNIECVDINPEDPILVSSWAKENKIDLVVVGPEATLVAGVADELRKNSISTFGPGVDGAKLEGSKAWMKDVLVEAEVPTAKHKTFVVGENQKAYEFLDNQVAPYIVKTDGLAAGKGVVVTDDIDVAKKAVDEYLSGEAFGEAGTTCVIEEGLTGPEISLFAICDGEQAMCVGVAQDHKRIGDGDSGPNTGGVGAYSPVPFVDDMMIKEIMDTCIAPTLKTLKDKGIDYRGVLFAGLMLTADGPKMLEYNVRFGDPECQVLMMRMTGDLALTLKACADGNLTSAAMSQGLHDRLGLSDYSAVTVVMTVKGYPENPELGDVISRIDDANNVQGVKVFYAGVSAQGEELVTSGGRVLNVTAIANDIRTARERAYEACSKINFEGSHYRTDIAHQALV
ncbi:MAG: phosphoribosylamine--glycine ligase [Acidimicrobiia bacterium]